MPSIPTAQPTKLINSGLPFLEAEAKAGVLYFTIDRGIYGKQYWKTDGINTVLLKEEF